MKHLAHFNALPLAATVLVLFASGCSRDGVKVYHVENSDTLVAPPPAAAPAAMPAPMPGDLPVPANGGQPQLKYTLPDGWQEKAPSAMRVASFGISADGKAADISVIPLGGMAGGDFANVNRWRGQVGLPPLADDDLHALAEKVEIAGQPADLYDLAGTGERIVGVIFHRDDATWFFKMSGDVDLVEKQKPAFVSFLKSFQFGGLAAPATMDLSQLPPSHPAIPGMDAGSQNSLVPNPNTTVMGGNNPEDSGKPAWTIPSDWQLAPLSQFLVAKFSITNADGAQAAVNVSSLAGDGGGLLANVNRWRGQLGLPPFTEADLLPYENGIDIIGSPYGIVDFTGADSRTGKPARLVSAVVPRNGQTWFYKLMGDPDLAAQQKDAFIKFVQSAKYPDAH